MNSRLATTIGVVFLLVFIYGVLAWRTKPSSQEIEKQVLSLPSSQSVSSDILNAAFLNKLRVRDINGELPVQIDQAQTYAGEKRSPFGLP